MAVDLQGNIFISDTLNHTICRVDTTGMVTTWAGIAGGVGHTDGAGRQPRFNAPRALALDGADNLYVADFFNHTIRKISPEGVVTTLAGTPGETGFVDGTREGARFSHPEGIAVDAAGNLFLAERGNHKIRKITPAGRVSTIGGRTGGGAKDDVGNAAGLNIPSGLSIDRAGNLIFADRGNHTIRKAIPRFGTPTASISPLDQQVDMGATARFTAIAIGSELTYQWFNDGLRIVGATEEALVIASAAARDSGLYSLDITSGGRQRSCGTGCACATFRRAPSCH